MTKHILKLATALLLMTSINARAQQVITTFAGVPQSPGYTGDNGPATDANLDNPSDIIVDASGNVYFTDFINNAIRKVDASGVIHTIAGTGYGSGTAGGGDFSGDGGPATAARLNGPFALTMDGGGNIYFADGYNHVVRKITSGGTISTIAGKASSAGYSGDAGQATDAELNNPVGVALDKAGNLYIADDHNNVIRKVTTAGVISTVVGNHFPGNTGDGGPALVAELNLPIGIAFDTAENMYIADAHNNAIRKVNKSGIISTYAGSATFSSGYTGDGGAATLATLDSPERVAFDDSNNLYISDYYNNVIRKVNAQTGIITTYAGNGYGAGVIPTVGEYGGDDSAATNAGIFLPHGIAFDHSHNAYIVDRGNDLIRKIGPKADVNVNIGVRRVQGYTADFLVYPNPTRDGSIAFKLTDTRTGPIAVSVTNLLGQTVTRLSTTTNKDNYVHLDAPTGVYMVKATSGDKVWTRQVVVE